MRPVHNHHNITRAVSMMVSTRLISKAIARKFEQEDTGKLSDVFKVILGFISISFGLGFGLYIGYWIGGSLNSLHIALRILFAVLIAGTGIGLFELFLKFYKDARYDELLLENALEEENKKEQ